ncbi:hypothetical protein BH11ARM1_BH11ARM1_06860 [soil metagenome]
MSVVIVIITILSALILPNVVGMKESSEHCAFFNGLWQMAGEAREKAISSNRQVEMGLDSGAGEFTISRKSSPTDEGQDDQVLKRLSIPKGIDTGSLSQNGSDSSTADWAVTFYPDGTSSGGSLQVTDADRVRSLRIQSNGTVSIIDGELPDESKEEWSAGELEQRA